MIAINGLDFSWKNNQLIEVEVEETTGEKKVVDIGIKSIVNNIEETSETGGTLEEVVANED